MSDVVVIGLGPAGLSAALKLAESGKSVRLVAKGEGGFQLSQGTVDVLGYSPERVTSPLSAISGLPAGHPYVGIGADKVRDAVVWLRDTVGDELLVGELAENYVLPTAVGAMRPTALAQPSMVAAHQAASYAVVGVRQLKDFPTELLAENLGCQAAWIDLPARREVDSSAHMFARAMDEPGYAKRFASAVAAVAPKGAVLLLPAILGVKPGTWRRIGDQLGRPIAEVPMQPPSVPGIRLHDALLARFKAAGGRVIIGSRVVGCKTAGGRVASVTLAVAGGPRDLKASDFVFAPGGFASGAITVDSRGNISEPLFGLPLTHTDANTLVGPDYWAPHPLFEVGVETDDAGRAKYDNLYLAGDIIAGAERWREKSGEGIAVATAIRAAESIMGGRA